MNTNESITATFTPNSVDHLFEDDFESGTLAAWNGADGAATVSTINPYQGTYHLACRLNAGANNGWSGTYKSVSGTNPLSVSAYVYFNSPPNTDNEDQWVLCLSSSTAGNALAYAGLRRVSGTLYWSIWYISDGTTFTYQVSSSVYSAGWHHLDLALFRGTSNDGWIKLFVDGAETCLASNLDNDARSLNYAGLDLAIQMQLHPHPQQYTSMK